MKKIAILAAMDVAFELMKLRDKQNDEGTEWLARVQRLQEKMTAVIHDSGVNVTKTCGT